MNAAGVTGKIRKKIMSTELTTSVQKTSYCLGLDVGMSMKRLPIELDTDALLAGMLDMLKDTPPKVSREEFSQLMEELQKTLKSKQESAAKDAGAGNVAAGAAYMAENAKKDGVTVTASGLQVEIIEAGAGAQPQATDTVRVHYSGKLLNGQEFDSSYSRGEPAEFPLNQVIAGWTEGLQLLKVGGKARLTIPPELAYGAQGAGNVIGPNSTLVFEVELLAVV
jgi:FKBP-type peptidyl-prolyl cis-trans isomerase